MSDLHDFAQAAIDAAYGNDPEASDDLSDELETDELEPDPTEEEAAEPSEEEAAAFWTALEESLSPEDYARAGQDQAYADALYGEWLEGANDAEAGSDFPRRGVDVVAMILGDDDLTTEAGDAISPAEWLRWAQSADPRAWANACAEAGWPPTTPQPTPADVRAFGRGVEGAVAAEDWEALLERRRRDGRYLGS